MSTTEDPIKRALVDESDWLHRLARQLVRDPALADDAAQETLIVLSRQPSGERPTRRWLGSVLRNFLRQGHRNQSKRGQREKESSSAASERSAQETAVLLETQRRVLDAVQALDEPYRSTITMRFLEGNAPREIARRMAVPVKIVHTRIERGLARLRSRLDRSYGGREEWLSILGPLIPHKTVLGLSGLGVLAMSTTLKWAGSVAALCLIGWYVQGRVFGERPEANPQSIDAPGHAALMSLDGDPDFRDEVLEEGPARRVELALPEVEEETVAPKPRVIGKVVDLQGQPLNEIEVRYELTTNQLSPVPVEDRWCLSDASGQFQIDLYPERGKLVGRGRGYAPVISPGIGGTLPAEPLVVVVGPERSYAGQVRDVSGKGLAGAEISVHLDAASAKRLRPGGLSRLVTQSRALTGEQGEFSIPAFGYVEGSELEAKLAGFEQLVIDLPPVSDTELILILENIRPTGGALAGVVLDQNGDPVEGAQVSAGQATTSSAGDGSFVLGFEPEDGAVLRAIAAGFLPGTLTIADVKPGQRDQLILILGGRAQLITGSVVDLDAIPIPGAQVWTFDGEHFGFVAVRLADVEVFNTMDIEQLIAGGRRDGRETHTDRAGEFELSSLVDRHYTILAMHPQTLVVERADAVMAGTRGLSIVLGRGERTARVAGSVENYAGEPVVGALIRVSRRIHMLDGQTSFRSADMDFHAVTDASGQFAFEELSLDGTRLLLNGSMIASAQSIELVKASDIEKIIFLVPASCHLRVFLQSDPEFAKRFELLDAQGKQLNISFMRGGVTFGGHKVGIEDGQSPLTQTDESARTIVFFGKDGREVHREPIELRAGKVNEIRF